MYFLIKNGHIPACYVSLPDGTLFLQIGVSKNNGTPKSSILIVFHYKPSILGYPYFWKHPNGPKENCLFPPQPPPTIGVPKITRNHRRVMVEVGHHRGGKTGGQTVGKIGSIAHDGSMGRSTVYLPTFTIPSLPNTCSEGVLGMFLGSKYLLTRCLEA